MRIVCFGWVNTQKKLKESKSGKPTPPPQTKKWSWRIFWLESFQASCSGESMASGFSLTLGGRLFPKGTFPIANKPFAPPKLTGMNKNYTFPFRGSAWLYKGPCQLAGFRGGTGINWRAKMGSVEMAATGVFEAWRFGEWMTTRGASAPTCVELGPSIAIMEVSRGFHRALKATTFAPPKKKYGFIEGLKKSPSLSLHNPIIRPHY